METLHEANRRERAMPPVMLTKSVRSMPRHAGTAFGAASSAVTTPRKDGKYFIGAGEAIYRHHDHEGDQLIIAPKGVAVPKADEARIADDADKRAQWLRLKLEIQMLDRRNAIVRKQEEFSDEDVRRMGHIPWADDQRVLTELYAEFSKIFGAINRSEMRKSSHEDVSGAPSFYVVYPNLVKIRKDPEVLKLTSIEIYDPVTDSYLPGPIFTQRVSRPRGKPEIRTALEALNHSLDSERDVFDLDHVRQFLPDRTPDEITAELAETGRIFRDPATDQWQLKEDYLCGDSRVKLKLAEAAAANDPAFAVNVAALKNIIPADIQLKDIDFTLGAPWMPPEVIEAFGRQTMEISGFSAIYVPVSHTWFAVLGENGSGALKLDILEKALNPEKNKGWGKDDSNPKLEESFRAWLEHNPAYGRKVERRYNDLFNSRVTPDYDGSHLTLPGSSAAIDLLPHQKNGIWRAIKTGNMLAAWAVGSGKTYFGVAALKEMCRRKKITRPTLCVPDQLLLETGNAYQQLFPNAEILTLQPDLLEETGPKRTPEQRMELFARRALAHEWDGIVMTRSYFDRFVVAPKDKLRLMLKDVEDIKILAADPAYSHGRVRTHLAGLMNKKYEGIRQFVADKIVMFEKLQNMDFEILESLPTTAPEWQEVGNALRPPPFPDYGSGYFLIDESHDYKNLEIESGDRELAREGATRANNLFDKVRVLDERNPGYVMTMMSGTPISNSLSELYTLERYMAPNDLRAAFCYHFDAWRAVHTDAVLAVEMPPEGGEPRLAKRLNYKNVPEAIRMLGGFAGIIGEDQLPMARPEIRVESVVQPLTLEQEEMLEWVRWRGERLRRANFQLEDDNMLSVLVDGRLAAQAPRLVEERYRKAVDSGAYEGPADFPEEPGKADALAGRVAKIYHDTKEQIYYDHKDEAEKLPGALQLIFCDTGVPKGRVAYSLYDEIRDKLIADGVPYEKIAFIHDHKNPRKKVKLFEKCRNGKIAVLIGTTEGLGTGANVQRRLFAIHELDIPWKPSGIQQRRGRIDRTGNANPIGWILRYLTRSSHDQYSWQTVLRKLTEITKIMRGDPTIRRYEEVTPAEQEFATMLEHTKPLDWNARAAELGAPQTPHKHRKSVAEVVL